uniref:Protein kinase domain-containing protein n=1 Tax=Panagrellus redivivus TaxID=6233 RepID=A0A7E4WE11_PANRE
MAGSKDPLGQSAKRSKKKSEKNDELGTSQSRKTRKKKAPEKKSPNKEPEKPAENLERSTKKKKTPSHSRASNRQRAPSARERKKNTPEDVEKKQIKSASPKLETDFKVIEAINVKKLRKSDKTVEDIEDDTKKALLANPKSIREGTKKCVHMWPTPADLEKLKDTPKPWSIPHQRQTQNLEYFLGRMPQWYIEEKFLKHPGDFTISRDAYNKYILSVKTKEPGNPCAHFVIEFAETQLVRNDRNYYHRIVGTVPQSNTVQGLINKYRGSTTNMLKQNTKRDAELLIPILPCQSCIYSRQEYNYHYVFVRNPKDVTTKEVFSKGDGYKLFRGTRSIRLPTVTESVIVRDVVIKEFDAQTVETLEIIFREMHIVQTIRFKIGLNTVVNIEGIVTVQKPFHVCYKLCSEGCLLQYLEKHDDDLKKKDKTGILTELACTMYQVHKLGYIHCDLCAKNIFVDIKKPTAKTSKEAAEPKKPRYYIGGWSHAIMEKTKKFELDKHSKLSYRYLAPEVFKDKELNESTDVYAFGLMIYETFTRKKPFHDVEDKDIKKHLEENPEDRPSLPDSISKSIQDLITECVDADPEKRPKMVDVWRKLRDIGDPGVSSAIKQTQQDTK